MPPILGPEFDEFLDLYADRPVAGSDQHKQLRDAFYSGALIASLRIASRSDGREAIHAELNEYFAQFKFANAHRNNGEAS